MNFVLKLDILNRIYSTTVIEELPSTELDKWGTFAEYRVTAAY